MGRVWFLRPRHGPKPKPEPLRKSRADLRLRPAGPANARSARDPGTHRPSCPDCQRELESLQPVVNRFVSWPTDVLRPTTSPQGRLALRIAEETGKQPVLPPGRQWSEPE